jgi:RNA polymerase sigma-70 factor (ECF subfamily)
MIVALKAGREPAAGNHHKSGQLALEAVYKEYFYGYFEKLFRYAFTITQSNAEAKDIVQVAFIKLWEKRDTINFEQAGITYLYKTVYHLSVNALRNHKTRNRHQDNFFSGGAFNDNTIEQKETMARIQAAVDTLPPRCREIFFKSRFEGKRYAAIAIEMDISVKTVEVQIGKALKLLRKELHDLALIILITIQIL